MATNYNKTGSTKNTYKTRYLATSPSDGNTEIFLRFDRTVYITKSGFSIDGTTLLTKAGGYVGFGRTLLWILMSLLGAAQVLLLPSVKLKSDFLVHRFSQKISLRQVELCFSSPKHSSVTLGLLLIIKLEEKLNKKSYLI